LDALQDTGQPPADATSGPDVARRDELVERLFMASIGALELFHVYLGDQLGLYRALRDHGGATPAELAAAAGVAERYGREWLEQQAVAGILEVVDDGGDDGATRRYRLPDAHAEVLLDADSLSFLAPLAQGVVGIGGTVPKVAHAFRTGAGLPYPDYGADTRRFIERLNRPMFLGQLAQEWVPAVPTLEERLGAGPPARVADLGCGTGWSSIAIALAYPGVHVDGFDLDEASVAQADGNAEQAGVADRVTFAVRDASDPSLAGQYDLVCAFETIHDMADPVGALRTMRALAAPDAVVLVADERVAEVFTAPGDAIERFNYGWSALHCLPVGLADPPATGTGTVMRPSTLERYAKAAGFTAVEILPIEHEFWRFYRLVA
jgi:SAM-dependent methyltransferase